MRAAYADGRLKTLHQLSKQGCAFDVGQAEPSNLYALRIVGENGNGVNHQIGSVDILGFVTDGDRNAKVVSQMTCGIGFQIVGAGYDVTFFLEHLGQTAHAGAADADHMDMLSGIIPDMGGCHGFTRFHGGSRKTRGLCAFVGIAKTAMIIIRLIGGFNQ